MSLCLVTGYYISLYKIKCIGFVSETMYLHFHLLHQQFCQLNFCLMLEMSAGYPTSFSKIISFEGYNKRTCSVPFMADKCVALVTW